MFFSSIPAVTKLDGVFLAKLIVALWFNRIFLKKAKNKQFTIIQTFNLNHDKETIKKRCDSALTLMYVLLVLPRSIR